MSLQKGRGPVQARSKADEGRAVLKYIDVDDLVPSEDNFYSMSDIDELAGLIELSGGVKQPALVVPLGGGRYKVIAGHRRRLASLQLVKQGKEQYRKMPCMVDADGREPGADAEADELRAIDEAILLITTNGQREKTDWDKVQEATRLRELLDRKRRFEKIPGETRKLIAEQLGTTPAQVGRYDSIAKHLIPRLKGWLEQGKIGISVAYELSMLPEEVQEHAAAELWSKGGPVTLEDVRKWKPSPERDPLPPGKITVLTADETGPVPAPEQTAPRLEVDVSCREFHCSDFEECEYNGQDICRLPAGMKCHHGLNPNGKALEPPAEENAGKIVGFPASPSPPPAPDEPEPEKETLSEKRAAYILEDLQVFCEEMLGIDAEQPETWAERADALTVAIAALRK